MILCKFKFHLIAFLLIIFNITAAQERILTGSEANKYIANASMVRVQAFSNIPAFVRFSEATIPESEALDFILREFNLDERINFKLIRSEVDEIGMTHSRYQQYFDNYPVLGGIYILHIKEGKVESMNGHLFKSNALNPIQISKETALQKAKDYVGAKIYKWEISAEEKYIKVHGQGGYNSYIPNPTFELVSTDYKNKNAKLVLAYKLDIYAHEPVSRQEIYINATDGSIVFKNDIIKHADARGTANTVYSGTKTIITDSLSPTSFKLRENSRGKGIETLNLNKGTDYNQMTDFLDSNNVWNNYNINKDQYATDAHWGAEMSYDYFFQKHGRNSIDNAGWRLQSCVHYGVNVNNAYWDGLRMTYGDGDSIRLPYTSLDIVGHELTHGLTYFMSNLAYWEESGALNESFSDIFGVCIDFFAKPAQANWLIADRGSVSAIRSLDNPKLYGQPNTYKGINYYIGSADNGGVHRNSGVPNYWFYLLAAGGSGTNDSNHVYSVQGLGIDTAAKIAYRTNAYYLGAFSFFADARFYSIQAARDLYGACSHEVKQTTNAWYAAGVGAKYDTLLGANFTVAADTNCFVPSTHVFTNTSFDGHYKWYFGDGDTSILLHPTHTYQNFGNYTVKLVATCGAVKDSIIKPNFIRLAGPTPVVFSKMKDTSLCIGGTITLKALSNYGKVKWLGKSIADSLLVVSPIRTTTYYFDINNGCSTFNDSIKVTVNHIPIIDTAMASLTTICLNKLDTLKATCKLRVDTIVQLGIIDENTFSTSISGSTPYSSGREGNRSQFLILATELNNLNKHKIYNLQFNLAFQSPDSSEVSQKNFTIKLANTSDTIMGIDFVNPPSGFTTVFGPAEQITPKPGWYIHNFHTPFEWDGVSNIVIDVCHDNDVNNTCNNCSHINMSVNYNVTPFISVCYKSSENIMRCGMPSGNTVLNTTRQKRRPVMKLEFSKYENTTSSTSWNWSPGNISSSTAVVSPSTVPKTSYQVIAKNSITQCADTAMVSINVIPLPISSRPINPIVCNQYTSASGKIYKSSGLYKDTVVNGIGCDSVFTINLTIKNSTFSTLSPIVCNRYISPKGKMYTMSGTYKDTLVNAQACDSIITINLTVKNSTISTLSHTSCNSYTNPQGKIYTTSGIYKDTLLNSQGCDSIITINLTITTINNTITILNQTLSSNEPNANYEWVECLNPTTYLLIVGATSQSYTVTKNGDYQVRIAKNSCQASSACISMVAAEIKDLDQENLVLYPNPTTKKFTIETDQNNGLKSIVITNHLGQIVYTKENISSHQLEVELVVSSGVYFVKLELKNGSQKIVKLLKN